MLGTIVVAAILVAVAAGLWLTRNVRGPRFGELRDAAFVQRARIAPDGDPIPLPADALRKPREDRDAEDE